MASKFSELEKENVKLKDELENHPLATQLSQLEKENAKLREELVKSSNGISRSDGYDFDGEFFLFKKILLWIST